MPDDLQRVYAVEIDGNLGPVFVVAGILNQLLKNIVLFLVPWCHLEISLQHANPLQIQ